MALVICGAVGLASLPAISGCKTKKDSIVLMTEELSGLFNPFYATAGADQDVIGMTQLSMLTYDADDKGNVKVIADDEHATVCKAYEIDAETSSTETVYSFVIKNGLKFSDGKPLTVNDVFFNLYEYLDPVYTGSSTMYSVKIKGLTDYRTQKRSGDSGANLEEEISNYANMYATTRREELILIYENAGLIQGSNDSYSRTEEQMRQDIKECEVTYGYKRAVCPEDEIADKENEGDNKDDYFRDLLLKDYEYVLKTFKEELEGDFRAAKESFDTTTAPYAQWKTKLNNDVFKFFLYEGYITPKYHVYTEAQDPNDSDKWGREDKTRIDSFVGEEILNTYKTQADAIKRVYDDNVTYSFNNVLRGWGTAGTVLTEYAGAAIEIVIKNTGEKGTGNSLAIPNITGIVSLGHSTAIDNVQVGGKSFKVAHQHNTDGTPVNENEYDVVQITVNGRDPKAIYNFGFSVAPAHYYTADSDHPNGREIDIANNKFGVDYASSSFQSNTIKSLRHVEVPVGAGPYMATNRKNGDNPSGSDFVNSNIVYYKANPNFMFEVKTEKLRLQVVSPSDALDVLQSGAVDFVTPQFTSANSTRLRGMTKSGYVQLDAWQLGYGYIGINAGKVKNINIRKAIMAAMQTSLALTYYDTGTCGNIDWPMSKMNWAYPFEADGETPIKPDANKYDYTQWGANETKADIKAKIQRYMNLVPDDQRNFKVTFTIAGASITEHPTYEVFKQAAEILKDMGWDVTVRADSQALTKLSTGSLEVWAAAWGSTIDPDMYQVYHKNSSATSVLAWGYREIKADPSNFSEETGIINRLSDVIDDARELMDQDERTPLYKQAMEYVLDLAVELPVYQRKNLYAYNGKTVKGFPTKVNAYTSPLEKVWELELVK